MQCGEGPCFSPYNKQVATPSRQSVRHSSGSCQRRLAPPTLVLTDSNIPQVPPLPTPPSPFFFPRFLFHSFRPTLCQKKSEETKRAVPEFGEVGGGVTEREKSNF
ncbi:hypothetical protein ElyMa_004903700 [Elysia marginata]|uniref:Uncharacterized protein n=1 Tax=Elysia marginata TaxID=1093978 RepID=A0AAV4IZZ8_9GAST|nr:hypothetical protein ElyMa_004903700 [Elysia marginata]